MLKKCAVVLFGIGILTFVSSCAETGKYVSLEKGSVSKRSLASFQVNPEAQECYDRDREGYTAIVDAHMHPRPFGGKAVPFAEMNSYFENTGVRFATYFGIGQVLEIDSTCTYYLDCPGTMALPSIKNDFVNAIEYDEFRDTHEEQNVDITLSMTCPDLANPEDILDLIHLYDKEFPGMFKWAGELNVIKQALLKNGHEPATTASIDKWSDFMKIIRKREIPVTLHSDLGNDKEPTKYLYLMKYILKRYPKNKIVWAHMGLSRELASMNPSTHIEIMTSVLDKNPNLMLDTSWRVLYDTYFNKTEVEKLYVEFFNKYSDRILNGTDFVASRAKNFEVYKNELDVISRFHKRLNDEAFRNIALGENYFRLLGSDYHAPYICK
ncbi:amidohydrolase family protein [Desulfobulbus sp. TB]|nr:amidohydrolase family protein [Desulfobulbus sp. TB]